MSLNQVSEIARTNSLLKIPSNPSMDRLVAVVNPCLNDDLHYNITMHISISTNTRK